MKLVLLGLAAFSIGQASAQSEVSFTSKTIVIKGDAAHKLFNTLEAAITRLEDKGTVWLRKNGHGMFCGKIEEREEYVCSIAVDRKGVF